MKKNLIILLFISLSIQLFSQSVYVDNSLLFSQNNYGGTARFTGMAGAFGALGGDLGSLSINPGGIGVFQSSELVFSPGLLFNKTESDYLGNILNDNKYRMAINNLGFVASYDLSNSDTRWVNFNIAATYNKTNNFNKNIIFQGNSNYSIMEYFVDNANASGSIDNLDGMYEYLVYDTYLMDTSNNEFWSQVTDEKWYIDSTNSFNLNQQKSIQTEGSISEVTIALGANYAHKLYVGLSVGIVSLKYNQYSSHYEFEDANTTDVFDFRTLEFKENSEISGTGVNIKLGAIYKPIDFIRLGVALHIPTFYDLEDRYYNQVNSSFDNGDSYSSESSRQTYEYSVTTPLRAIGSAGFQIGKFALIDVDYEYVDYSTMKLDDEFNSQDVKNDNLFIQNNYVAVHNIRAGAELKSGQFYVRGGAGYSTSPYKKTDISLNHDSYILTYAGGVGYREKHLFIDFAFSQTANQNKLEVFPGNPYYSTVDSKQNNFILTFGIKF